MGELSKGISVASLKNRVYACVVGRGTFQNSQPLRQFTLNKIDEGHEVFVIDFSACQGLDSTFLGMLAGIGLRLRRSAPPASIHLVNLKPRNMDMLRTLGLESLFFIDADAPAPPVDTDYQLLPDTDITQTKQPLDKDGAANLVIEAHDNLVRVDQRNTPRFKELTRILRETNRSLTRPVKSP
jgi:anti-sigma B factor antagonist